MSTAADLVLGPLLRYVSETEATIWVETSAACEVEVLGRREPTFRVEGHHYALVRLEGLEAGRGYEYEVALDGACRWPEPSSKLPTSVIRTLGGEGPLHICFGSCRVALPHEPPYTESKDSSEVGREIDALWVLADQIAQGDRGAWPDQLFLLGDQVYVDEGSPRARERIRARRGTATPPGEEVTDFEEYTWLYEESWREPLIRWLFANVSISMLWDDHDMSDDWNISRSWLAEMRQRSWWHRRAVGCIASYWIYQHLGNLSPDELDRNDLLCDVAFRGSADRSPVYQAVCSPYRNPLDRRERAVVRAGFGRPLAGLASGLARLAGAPEPGIRWRLLEGPYFDNQVASLRLDGRRASMRLDKTVPGEDGEHALEPSFTRRLA